jgi:hypothetical protein
MPEVDDWRDRHEPVALISVAKEEENRSDTG